MAKNADETGLRSLGMVAAAMVFWFVAAAVSMKTLARHPQSAVLRTAMVALGVAGLAVFLGAVTRLISRLDEFSRRIHLVSVALTCALTAVGILAADLLQAAGFVDAVPLQAIWMGMGVLWWVSMVITARYYR